MPDNYYSEFNENGVVTPFRDLAAFPRSEQAVLGAKNRMIARFNRASGSQSGNVTMTYGDDRIISLSGTAGAGAEFDLYRRVPNNNDTDNYLPLGKYKYTIGESIPSGISVYVATTYNGAFKNISGNACPGGVEFEITADTQSDYKKSDGSTLVAAYFAVANGIDTTGIKLYPMISFDGGTYAPPAMTNKELTDKVSIENMADYISFTDTTNIRYINGKRIGSTVQLQIALNANTPAATYNFTISKYKPVFPIYAGMVGCNSSADESKIKQAGVQETGAGFIKVNEALSNIVLLSVVYITTEV